MKSKKLKIIGLLSTLFFGAFLIFFDKSIAQLTDTPWPMLQNNVRHTGLSPYSTSRVDGTIKWTYETGAGIESSPTIAPDGTIYIGSQDKKVYAFGGSKQTVNENNNVNNANQKNNSTILIISLALLILIIWLIYAYKKNNLTK